MLDLIVPRVTVQIPELIILEIVFFHKWVYHELIMA